MHKKINITSIINKNHQTAKHIPIDNLENRGRWLLKKREGAPTGQWGSAKKKFKQKNTKTYSV